MALLLDVAGMGMQDVNRSSESASIQAQPDRRRTPCARLSLALTILVEAGSDEHRAGRGDAEQGTTCNYETLATAVLRTILSVVLRPL
jgi:hypothetical protein